MHFVSLLRHILVGLKHSCLGVILADSKGPETVHMYSCNVLIDYINTRIGTVTLVWYILNLHLIND